MVTEDEIEALDFMRNNNVDGVYDNILDDFDAGKITVYFLKFNCDWALEHCRTNNYLGRYDELIARADELKTNPPLVIAPKAKKD